MVRVNKKYLEKELTTRAWGKFLKEIKATDRPEKTVTKLHAFLTPSEITMLEKRLAIPLLLEQKLSYRNIAKILDVSPVTISFVKHNLTRKPPVHRKYSSPRRTARPLPILPPRSHHMRWLLKKIKT